MQKKMLCLVFVVFSVFCLTGTAKAVTFVDLNSAFFLMTASTASSPYNYTHNINDNGYNPVTDTITSASLSILLSDDLNPLIRDGFDTRFFGAPIYEYADITYEGESSLGNEVDILSLYTFNIAPSFLSDGLLNIGVNATSGDFYFAGSLLTVNADRRTPVVPEPATLSLLGLGLVGLVGLGRKKIKVS